MKKMEKMLAQELRMYVISDEKVRLSDDRLTKAITLNENLKAFGYCLKPADIVTMARSTSLDTFYEEFKSLQNDVKAAPMYPDFPSQVMDMDEAEFRMHQLVHYFSTYGLETLFGVEVSKGWLPDVKSTDKTETDKALLEAKTIELVSENDMFIVPVREILGKKERMTNPEKKIIAEAIRHIEPEALTEINIPFKENLPAVFCLIAESDSQEKAELLKAICQHSGDAWRCIHSLLGYKRYRLATSEKKFLVKFLEMFDIADFKANLIISDTKAEKIIRDLEFLSFNRFSRSAEHKEAVRALRNGELHSWMSQCEYLLSNEGEKVLDFISQRPGMLVRMTARLIRMGYDADEIASKLTEHASALSMQTLITLLNHFGKDSVLEKRKDEAENVYSVMLKALTEKMKTLDSPIKGKSIFLDEGDFNFDLSRIEINEKSKEGGYIRSGLAFKIPETVRRVRFFVYWNDKYERVDVDLHCAAITKEGRSFNVGWDSDFNRSAIVHSGDITHPDAAEYIDIDLDKTDVENASFSIKLFSGKPNFGAIDECFVGMTAVNSIKENIKLYDPKNCFFSHELRANCRLMLYGNLDVLNRALIISAKPSNAYWTLNTGSFEHSRYSLNEHLKLLAQTQDAKIVSDRSDADVVLVMGKPNAENEISIIDNNFFCD